MHRLGKGREAWFVHLAKSLLDARLVKDGPAPAEPEMPSHESPAEQLDLFAARGA